MPVGLIESAFGGTPAEAWTSRKALDAEPSLRRLKGSNLYDSMIVPLIPFAIRGAIWYQGESNVGRAYQYRTLFPTMIRNWRTAWGQRSFPFFFVQIAPCTYNNPQAVAELWEAQLLTLKSMPATGMAVTTDIGELHNIHPVNKQEVGRRLALWALAETYGRKGLVCSGPIYKSMQVEDGKIRLTFDYAEGLALPRRQAAGLLHDRRGGSEVPAGRGADRRRHDCRFGEGSGPAGGGPLRLCEDAMPNLVNAAGLPASPFRTDAWKGVTEGQELPKAKAKTPCKHRAKPATPR